MTTFNTTTEGQYVRLSLRGMHLALSKLIAIINAQPENTVLYINKDIKESGAWRYALAIEDAYQKEIQSSSLCTCESIVEMSPNTNDTAVDSL